MEKGIDDPKKKGKHRSTGKQDLTRKKEVKKGA